MGEASSRADEPRPVVRRWHGPRGSTMPDDDGMAGHRSRAGHPTGLLPARQPAQQHDLRQLDKAGDQVRRDVAGDSRHSYRLLAPILMPCARTTSGPCPVTSLTTAISAPQEVIRNGVRNGSNDVTRTVSNVRVPLQPRSAVPFPTSRMACRWPASCNRRGALTVPSSPPRIFWRSWVSPCGEALHACSPAWVAAGGADRRTTRTRYQFPTRSPQPRTPGISPQLPHGLPVRAVPDDSPATCQCARPGRTDRGTRLPPGGGVVSPTAPDSAR
jgi:hypothetical protein